MNSHGKLDTSHDALTDISGVVFAYYYHLKDCVIKDFEARGYTVMSGSGTSTPCDYVATDKDGNKEYINLRSMDVDFYTNSNPKDIPVLYKKTAAFAKIYERVSTDLSNTNQADADAVRKIIKNWATSENVLNNTVTRDVIRANQNMVTAPVDTGGAEVLRKLDDLISEFRYALQNDYARLQAQFIETTTLICNRYLAHISAKLFAENQKQDNVNYKALLQKSHPADKEYILAKIRLVLELRDGILQNKKKSDTTAKIEEAITFLRLSTTANVITAHHNAYLSYFKWMAGSKTESTEFLAELNREAKNFELRTKVVSPTLSTHAIAASVRNVYGRIKS